MAALVEDFAQKIQNCLAVFMLSLIHANREPAFLIGLFSRP